MANIPVANVRSHKYQQRKIVASDYDKLFVSIGRRDGFQCAACDAPSRDLQIDHIIPVSQGGKSTESNLQLLCAACNNDKQAQTIDFRRVRIMYGVNVNPVPEQPHLAQEPPQKRKVYPDGLSIPVSNIIEGCGIALALFVLASAGNPSDWELLFMTRLLAGALLFMQSPPIVFPLVILAYRGLRYGGWAIRARLAKL